MALIRYKKDMVDDYGEMSTQLSITVSDQMDEEIEKLVERGVFSSKTSVIEEGLRMVFYHYQEFDHF